MRKNAGPAKIAVVVIAALCLPLAACSKGGDKNEISFGTGSKSKNANWMNGPSAKGKGANAQIGGKGGAGWASNRHGVKVPRIGGSGGKSKKKNGT